MEQYKSKVYVQTDEQDRIIRCEGGYTTPRDLTSWTYIDEGTGDKFNLCQSHYFKGGLFTMDDIPRYKLVDGKPVLRSDNEIAADRAARPEPEPSASEDMMGLLVDQEYRLTLLELGLANETEV